MKPHWPLALMTFGAAVLVTLVELVPPWLVKVIIDDVIKGRRVSLLPWLIFALVSAYFFKNLLAVGRIWSNNLLEQKVIYDLRDQVYRTLQRLSISYFENRSTGELMSRVVSDVNNVERIFIDGVEAILMASLTLTGISAVLFYLNWRLALLALIPVPFLILGASFFTRRIHSLYHLIRQKSAQLSALLQDSLSGIRETMSFNRAPYEIDRFNRLSLEYCNSSLKVARLWGVYSPSMIFLGSIGVALILWYGTHQVIAGRLTLGELVAFLSYLALFYTPINQIHSVNHMLQQALASGERVFEILDAEPEVKDRPDAAELPMKIQGGVRFEEASFNYRPEVSVLKRVSFEILPGEHVALVGPSGGGKSTIIKLLMRFYDVDSGRITLDGYDLQDLKLSFLRDQIGIVQQEPFLFNGTVRENIVYGNLQADETAIIDAARLAHAHDFIIDLPEGYDTWIGERGVKLSVGQKQRLAIARAALKDPAVIIFDEATSNIDTETEVKIQEALEDLTRQRTTLIIAHRLSTLRHVDKILVVDEGRIVEEGTHDQLLGARGLYTALYEAQFETN
jgi:ATP-binding cassette subfamily B protein/subfamily B ATP-binding cassette protein MsbA